jgi:hypothetical protein
MNLDNLSIVMVFQLVLKSVAESVNFTPSNITAN